MLYALHCEASHRCCRTSGQSTKCSCNCHQYKLSTPVDDLYTAYTCIHIYVYTRSEHSHHNRSIIDEDVFVVAYFYVIRLSCCFAFGSIRCEYAFLPSFYLSTYLLWPKFSFVAQFSTSKWLVIEMYSTQVLQRIENTDVFFIHFYIDFTRIPEIAQKTLHVLNIYFYLYILIATSFYDFSAFDFWNHGHRWIIQITDFTTIHVKSNKM